MRDRSKQLLVINTGKKPSELPSQSGNTHIIGGGGLPVNMSDYLLKSIWDKVFELKTDSQGTDYIFSKLPVVTQYGITMYSGNGVDIPSLASGLPFDGRTIWYNPDTNQIEVIGGTGGGSGEGVPNFWDLSGIPSWITISKPKYTYSEIGGTPDLSVFATQNWIISQGYASAEELKKYIPISGYTEVSGEKNFTGGLKVNGSPIYYDTEKKYWKLEGDLLVTGGVTMYGVDSTDIPSLINSLPIASTKEKGVAYFDPNFFSVSSDGKVSFIGETGGGLDITALQNYLTQNSYLNVTEGDNRYLKLSGGTLTASGNPLTLKRTDGYAPGIEFYLKDVRLGSLGLHADGTPYVYMASESAIYNLWHSGNDGDGSGLDADLLDGLQSTAFARSYKAASVDKSLLGIGYDNNSLGSVNLPSVGGYVSATQGSYGFQLLGNYVGTGLYYRGVNNGAFSNWKTIAFIDSNVASATKLQTARTIWGQSFDGTGNVSGNLKGSYFTIGDRDNAYIELLGGTNYGYVQILADGSMAVGSNTSSSIIVNQNGNVGIGTSSPSYKLDVDGSIRSNNVIITKEYGLFLNNGFEGIYIHGSGISWHDSTNSWSASLISLAKDSITLRQNTTVQGSITTNDSVTINGIKLSKSKDGVLYLDGNLIVKGGVTMYGTDATSSPSILNSLPIASTTTKGVAYFDSEFFSVGSDGKVSFIGKTGGFNATELQNYLTQNSYLNTTQGDDRYLKLTGGAITVNQSNGLRIIRTGSKYPAIAFYDNDTMLDDYIGFNPSREPVWFNSSGNVFKFWHSGNDGDDSGLDADLLDGLQSTDFARSYKAASVDKSLVGIGYDNSSMGSANLPTSGGFISATQGKYGFQLLGGFAGTLLCFRGVNNGAFSDWKTIAFTDSNVASATKLKTEITIWGKSFDGTGNISGNLSLESSKIVWHKDSNAYYIGCPTTSSSAYIEYNGYGGHAFLGGNVGIGTKTPSHNLHVVGNTYLNGDVFADELNTFDVLPRTNNAYSCGNSSLRWYQVYGNIGDFSGAVNMGSTLNVTGMTTMTNATITGDLRLKDTTNYGRAICFGDGEFCYLKETSDDVLTIYASHGIKLNTSSTSYNVSINTNLLVSGGITMYSQRSLKNIQDDRGLSLGELRAIKPIRYTWKDNRDNRLHIGGIADDIQQVLPEVVYKTNDGVLTMDYGNAAFAIASSLIKPVVDHEKRIAMLEEENKQLRQEVERLKSA